MTSAKEPDDGYTTREKQDFEHNVRQLNFEHFAIMKPMWLNREEAGKWYEKLYTMFSKNVTKVSDMAHCLVWASLNQTEKEREYFTEDMRTLWKIVS